MIKNKLIASSEGFSLIELMMTAAVTSVLIMGSMNFMKTRLSDAKYIESVAEAEGTLNNLKLYFLDKDACLNTLGNIIIPSNSNTPVNIPYVMNRANIPIYDLTNVSKEFVASSSGSGAINSQPNTGVVRLMKLELFNTEGVMPDSYGQAEIRAHFVRDVKRTKGVENIQKKIHISIGTDSAMKLKKCFSSTENAVESAYKLVCEDLGGEYDDQKGKCQFFAIVNGQNTKAQCTNIGGQIYDSVAELICLIPEGIGIPANWTPYKSWTATTVSSPTDSDCATSDTRVTAGNIAEVYQNASLYSEYPASVSSNGTCPTSAHTWSDQAVETCSFTCTEKSPCSGGTCRSFTKTLRAKVTERGYY